MPDWARMYIYAENMSTSNVIKIRNDILYVKARWLSDERVGLFQVQLEVAGRNRIPQTSCGAQIR